MGSSVQISDKQGKLMTKSMFVAAVVLTLAGSGQLMAATPAELTEAESFLANSKPRAALRLLTRSHDPATAKTQEFFLLGVAAKQAGEYHKAEEHLLRAKASDPSAGRIRLELAEVQFALGKPDAARAELLAVQTMNPPPEVRRNIDTFVGQIDAAKMDPSRAPRPPKNWSAFLTAGLTLDSNVNGGPDRAMVTLFGLPFTLSSDATETADEVLTLRAGVTHTLGVTDNLDWTSNARVDMKAASTVNAYDTMTVEVSTGPSLTITDRLSLNIPISQAMEWDLTPGRWTARTMGIEPRLRFVAGPTLQMFLDAELTRKVFRDNTARDVTEWSLSPALNYRISPSGLLAMGVQVGAATARSDIHSNTMRGGHFGYQHRFDGLGLTAGITLSATETRYKGVQPASGVARNDLLRRIDATLAYAVPDWWGTELIGTLGYQDNSSNIEMQDFDRTQLSVALTKRF